MGLWVVSRSLPGRHRRLHRPRVQHLRLAHRRLPVRNALHPDDVPVRAPSLAQPDFRDHRRDARLLRRDVLHPVTDRHDRYLPDLLHPTGVLPVPRSHPEPHSSLVADLARGVGHRAGHRHRVEVDRARRVREHRSPDGGEGDPPPCRHPYWIARQTDLVLGTRRLAGHTPRPALVHLSRGRGGRAGGHPPRDLRRVLVPVLRAWPVPQPGRPDRVPEAVLHLPRHPDSDPPVRLEVVVVAASLAAGPVLRRVHEPGHRPLDGPAAHLTDGQPWQPLDLVDEPALRGVPAVLHRPVPQLPRHRDPARVPLAVPAVVPDQPRAFHVPHVRRPHLHGARPGLRGGPHRRAAEAPRPDHARRRLPQPRGALLLLLLSHLDGTPDFRRGLLRRTADSSLGPEDLVGQLPQRPASQPAAVVLLELAPAAFLAACVAAGFGLTYLIGIGLLLEERIVFGAVLGATAVAALSLVLSLAVRDVTALTVLAALGVVVLLGAAALAWQAKQLVVDLAGARARWWASPRTPGHPWPLAAVALVCGAWTVHFLHQAYVYTPAGLYAGYVNIWGDWAAHLSFAGSFAYGHNFPPEYPIDPGHHLGYPFMIDFLAANLVPLGSSLTSALVLTSGLLGLAFPAVLYVAAQRFAGGRAAAVIAVSVFLLSGGLGFVYLAGDIQHLGLAALVHLPREYTLNRDLNFQWLNPLLAYLVPQRSTLFGFSLALILLVILWLATRGEGSGWQPFVFAGIVAGVLPVYHVHAYGTVVALSAFWAFFTLRIQWLGFFIPARRQPQ